MGTKTFTVLFVAALILSACGADGSGGVIPDDGDEPVLQVTYEGGFAPVEANLGHGPRYTLLADHRLIYEGPVIATYPGPLLPNYLVTKVDDEDVSTLMDLVEMIGLPGIDHEIDNSRAAMVADATTDVVTYWDANGSHTYGVYALGIEPKPEPRAQTFVDLVDQLGDLATTDASPYEPDRVRVIAGPGNTDPEFDDVRDWPLEGEDLADWQTLPNDWSCRVFEPDVLDLFTDATQATVWSNQDPSLPDSNLELLVRPLQPGEPDCPAQV